MLTALSRLTDPQLKARVVQFLYEAHLIGYYDSTHSSLHNSTIDLSGANLDHAQVLTEALALAKSLKGATMPDGSNHP